MPDAVVKIKAEAADIHSPKPHHTHRLWPQGLWARQQTLWCSWYHQGPRMGAALPGPHGTGIIAQFVRQKDTAGFVESHERQQKPIFCSATPQSHQRLPSSVCLSWEYLKDVTADSAILLLRPLLDHLSLSCDPHKPISHPITYTYIAYTKNLFHVHISLPWITWNGSILFAA